MRLLHQLTEQEPCMVAGTLFGLVVGLTTTKAALTHDADHAVDKGQLEEVVEGHTRELDVGGLDED